MLFCFTCRKVLFSFFFFNFFFFLLYFALQCCIDFAIHWHESAMGAHELPIPNPPPTPYHLSGSSLCTSPKHPVAGIEHRLANCFLPDSMHVSMPFSQIIPPSPSPTESKSPFYTSVSLLLSHIQSYHYHLSKFHICVSILYWCFSFWFTSFCIIGSSFIHLIRTDSNVFFLMAE